MLLKRLDPDTPLKIKGLLHLATKYDMTSIRSMLIQQLESDWPLNLEDWRKMYDQQQDFLRRKATTFDSHNLDLNFPEAASAFRMAVDYDIPSIIPAIVYTLITIPLTHNWDDERTFPHGKLYGDIAKGKIRTAKWEMLTVKEILQIARAKEVFCTRSAKLPISRVAQGFCHDSSIPCQCILEKIFVTRRELSPSVFSTQSPDPLKSLREMFLSQDMEFLCNGCRQANQELIRAKEQEHWNALIALPICKSRP